LSGSNLNLNLNLDLLRSASSPAGRARFNSQVFAKMSTTGLVPASPYPDFFLRWDHELQAYEYLREFVEVNTGWFATMATEAELSGRKPANKMSTTELEAAVVAMLDAAPEREDRFAEIIDQADSEGAINYWLGMLMIDPARQSATHLMVRVARRIGEMVVMCLKAHFKAPRPSQLCPMIVPMIDPPATPSFPAGHALQSYLISHCLFEALPNTPQTTAPTGASPGTGLFALAERVADNRLIAGLHFQVDNEAGAAVAKKCLELLTAKTAGVPNCPKYDTLRTAVRGEFPKYA
jgi:hypothetical protein